MTNTPLPCEDDYTALSAAELETRIELVRQQLDVHLNILGHHYQSDAVLRHANLRGDSFFLSRKASETMDCETIVFCGVHFMAETADILANAPDLVARRNDRHVPVLLPSLEAGCSMADMATGEQVETAWKHLEKMFDATEIIPVTYVNSSAQIKAFCGRRGGLACTSSNAQAVLKWAFEQGERVLFLPDRMLGFNTAVKMGVSPKEMAIWNRETDTLIPFAGGSPEKSRVILWDGYCDVHQKFTVEQIAFVREQYPDIQVIVHPECDPTVVQQADLAGSTSEIITIIDKSPAGTKWAVGTESTLVERLKKDFPDRTIVCLSPIPSICPTMEKGTLANLCFVLENLLAGVLVHQISVDESLAADARLCLKRMLRAK